MISIYGEVIANEGTIQYASLNKENRFHKTDTSAWGAF
jgi:hypothetical protein